MMWTEGMFETAGGLRLFEQRWRPDGDIKAVVVIIHGYAEHSSRYMHVAEYLVRHGYAVYTFDLRGHGKSEGTRVLVRSFEEYLSDLKCFLARLNDREPGRPIFMFGHSMGGTIVTLFSIIHRPDVRGLILSGPLLKISGKISTLRRFFISVAGYIFPTLPAIKKLNYRLISSSPDAVAKYDSDPLVYRGKLLAREGREINRAVNCIQKRMEDISLPLLILHGTADYVVDIEGSKQLYARAGSADKTIKLYEGFYHEVLNEPDKDRVLADMVTWLDAHSNKEIV